jgi:hypothetical protein
MLKSTGYLGVTVGEYYRAVWENLDKNVQKVSSTQSYNPFFFNLHSSLIDL